MGEPYFRYFPAAPEISTWGLGVTGTGRAIIPPGGVYPPIQHPADHHFTWERGRVLESMQMLLISRGAGFLETKSSGSHELQAGSAFILLPGEWHRYRPDPSLGWNESWCEMRGPLIEQLLRDKVLDPLHPLRRDAYQAGLEEAADSLHRRVQALSRPGFDPELAALGMRLLAVWSSPARRESGEETDALHAVAAAERYIADHLAEAIDLEALAQRSGIAYSHFRRLFRNATGYSPWQYIIHLRLEMARRNLASGDGKLRDIAESLGFSSAFHFSTAFRNTYGVSPTEWRRRLRKQSQAVT